MAEKRSEAMKCSILGRLGREPEVVRTLSGAVVCRLVVVKKAAGPASNPTLVGLYLEGEEAKRCGRGLHEGDLIGTEAGELRSRRAGSKVQPRYPEVVVDRLGAVKLYERAGVAA